VARFDFSIPTAVRELAENVENQTQPLKGASDCRGLAVSLKQYPDTKPGFSAKQYAAPFSKQIQTEATPGNKRNLWAKRVLVVGGESRHSPRGAELTQRLSKVRLTGQNIALQM
jgi:hypothetical protein